MSLLTDHLATPWPRPHSYRQLVLSLLGLLFLATVPSRAEVAPHRGLWVGQATLTRVNEVSVPLDEENIARAPDSAVATPTADAAHLRLILHVNGAGQVGLLKDVAILARSDESDGTVDSESDMALVTDAGLYADYPVQPATRIASAVFDFGDSRATDALNAVMEEAAGAAAAYVLGLPDGYDLDDQSDRLTAIADAEDAAVDAATPLVSTANVASVFSSFLSLHLTQGDVEAIAADTNAAADAMAAAAEVRDGSFYADSRGLDMVSNIMAAAEAAGTNLVEREDAARNMAASFADVTDNYQRFTAGKQFGDMITAAAEAAATAATNAGATEASIRAAVDAEDDVREPKAEALRLRIAAYSETRASDAVSIVLDAVVGTVVGMLPVSRGQVGIARMLAEEAGQEALLNDVIRYALAPQCPTPDYNSFVTSEVFEASAETAAKDAAEAAVRERRYNALYTGQSVSNAARIAAFDALRSAYGAAARAVRNELPLTGTFGPGEGDARMTWEIKQAENAPDLEEGALTGTIFLPASHPTNPFRHRRHPDHTIGFDIVRHIRLDFHSTPSNATQRVGFGVERITGVYREEIMGLHKPLGQDKDMGLRTEGTFELNRISLIDTLNSR